MVYRIKKLMHFMFFLASCIHRMKPRITSPLSTTSWWIPLTREQHHYNDVIMGAMGSQITSLTIVYSTVYSGLTALCAGNTQVTDEFPAKMASNAENVSIWWRHHDCRKCFHVMTSRYHVMTSQCHAASVSILRKVFFFVLNLGTLIGLFRCQH